ncbi:hypothetical protein ACGRHY_19730 [Streptomyces sp. HK10]|uniref:hypothetical protein n=1 Tax=Streptomyces sp. HK10 TaxID=3373255 RepID=UPI00374A93D5
MSKWLRNTFTAAALLSGSALIGLAAAGPAAAGECPLSAGAPTAQEHTSAASINGWW